MEALYVFICCFFTIDYIIIIILDLAATLFTPETPKVFCGLKHFTEQCTQGNGGETYYK